MKIILRAIALLLASGALVLTSCTKPDTPVNPDSEQGGGDPAPDPVTPVAGVAINLSAQSHIEANVSISGTGDYSHYGGYMLISPDVNKAEVAGMFLEDASSVIMGFDRTTVDKDEVETTTHVYIPGSYGMQFDSNYSGKLSAFVPHDNGDGKMENNILKPGAEYAVCVILFKKGTDAENADYYKSLSTSDVSVKYVRLNALSSGANGLVTLSEDSKTTNSVTAKFNYTVNVSRAYFIAQKKSEYDARSIEDEISYAIYKGGEWDRAATKVSGPYDMTLPVTLLKDGEEAVFTTVAINAGGRCEFTKLVLTPETVEESDGTLSITGCNSEKINDHSYKVSFTFASDGIEKVRFLNEKTLSEFNNYYGGSETEVYSTLTTGNMWDYEQVSVSENPYEVYIAPEDGEKYILWAVGVDAEDKFTKLVRYDFDIK